MRQILLVLIVATALVAAFVLFFLREINAQPDIGGGFTRRYDQWRLSERSQRDLLYNSYYVAGLSCGRVYFGNYTAPSYLLHFSETLEDFDSVRLSWPRERLARRALEVRVVGNLLAVTENITPAFVPGNLKGQQMRYFALADKHIMAIAAVISSSSIIVKSYDSLTDQATLRKIDLRTGGQVNSDVLKKQIDGIFCTDGQLLYDPQMSHLAYVYYYRNEVLSLDTNLNLIGRSKTLDTVTTAHLKVGTISSEKTRTLTAPPLMVNRKASVFNNWLIVNSALRGDGEKDREFRSSSVFDVYHLPAGKYHFSFSIPDLDGFKVKSFLFNDSTFLLLQGQYLVRYHINLKGFIEVDRE